MMLPMIDTSTLARGAVAFETESYRGTLTRFELRRDGYSDAPIKPAL